MENYISSSFEMAGQEPDVKQRLIRDTSRIEAFSDGVIAVAITLLVLNVHIPDVKPEYLLQALIDQWPTYLGYTTSFLVIGVFWANHHNMFCYIRCVDHVLLLVNTFFLMCIVFIPFATSLLTEYVTVPTAEHIVAATYSATLFLNGLCFNAIWWHTTKNRLFYEDIDPQTVRRLTMSYLIGLPIYLVSLFVSLVNVEASLILYIIVTIIYSFPINRLYINCKVKTS